MVLWHRFVSHSTEWIATPSFRAWVIFAVTFFFFNSSSQVTKQDVVENDVVEALEDKDANPMNLTIAELRNRAEIRRMKMKDFNYKFINNLNQHIDEIESEPAYKRMGVNLDEVPSSSETDKNKSRMTLGTDDNDDIQLRSNNSFLHDNVD